MGACLVGVVGVGVWLGVWVLVVGGCLFVMGGCVADGCVCMSVVGVWCV